jgi:hypothetical protein
VAIESKPAYEWAGLVGEVLVILLGAWMISRGWTDFGLTVVIVGFVGFVVSTVRLWRIVRRRADG